MSCCLMHLKQRNWALPSSISPLTTLMALGFSLGHGGQFLGNAILCAPS